MTAEINYPYLQTIHVREERVNASQFRLITAITRACARVTHTHAHRTLQRLKDSSLLFSFLLKNRQASISEKRLGTQIKRADTVIMRFECPRQSSGEISPQ